MIDSIIKKLEQEIARKLNEMLIEGLKRKGFEFDNNDSLENFLKLNCRAEHRTDIKENTYFVNNIPFLLHCYEIKVDAAPIEIDREIKMSDNYGRYAFL